jgi:peptidoglycan/LPS O-acetylase OafA/YrhL
MFLVALVVTPAGFVAARHYGWSDLLFVTNYTYGANGLVNGSWSLCAEEQFYILAPLLLILIGNRSEHLYRSLLFTALLAEPVIRFLEYRHLTGHWLGNDPDAMQVLYFPLHTHSDGLIYGLLIANLVFYRHKITSRILPWLSIALGVVLIVIAFGLHIGCLDFSALAFTFGGVVWLSTQREFHLFDGAVFYWLSRLSFGMYLNHEYLEHWVASTVVPALGLLRLGHNAASFGCFLLLTTFSSLLAVVTFCLIEHPFLVLRTRLLRSKEVVPLVASAS